MLSYSEMIEKTDALSMFVNSPHLRRRTSRRA